MAGPDFRVVFYDSVHWELLRGFRSKACRLMEALEARSIVSAVYGSVARGDVDRSSDVDIIIPRVTSSSSVELALEIGGFRFFSRRIAQATPGHTPKAHIYLDPLEKVCVTFPLAPFRPLELEFYRFGGLLGLEGLGEGRRVPGCDKRLMLIQPTEKGHLESPVIGRESEVADIVGVRVEVVEERVRVLKRRGEIGRTGIVFQIDLEESEVFEEVLKRAADSNPIVRRRLRMSRD